MRNQKKTQRTHHNPLKQTGADTTGGTEASSEGENLTATPGSTQGGTLSGRAGYMAGGTVGREPKTPERVPPYGPVSATPIGTEEAIEGSTTGDLPEDEVGESVTDSFDENEVGSTIGGTPRGTTEYSRALTPDDLYSTRRKRHKSE